MTTKKKPEARWVNVDMDGVVYDFVHAMRMEVTVQGVAPALRPKPDPDTYYWDKGWGWGMTGEEMGAVFKQGIRRGRLFARGPAIDGALSGLEYLHQAGFNIALVTSKLQGRDVELGVKAAQNTLEWLKEHEVVFDRLIFTSASGGGKTALPAVAVIDDHPDQAWAFPGASNILFGQPWNEEAKLRPGVARVDGWDSILLSLLDEIRG